MAITLSKFNCFVEDLAEKAHNLQADTLKIALTNTLPTAAQTTWNTTDHPAPASAFGYPSGGITVTVNSSTQTSGVYRLKLANTSVSASGGAIGPFRYLVLYNSTATNKAIGWGDYGSSETLNDAENLAFNFDQTNGVIAIT